ncbi:hypothetical protein JCM8097_007442 [Rhodosporidiobolus ruineniae]
MAKVYSGLHEAGGHIVRYVVIVKVGKPTERHRPGNRGKRDSQMLLMRFLNRVHFTSPMTPAELEMYHQIKNFIGVNPSFYEYLLAVDADTTVAPDSLNYLVGGFVERTARVLIGLCGETCSPTPRLPGHMMQVYEYFISHHMAKAFESLFGSVTCLPGCFSMYRLRTLEHKPVLISDDIITEYGENKVETLHIKNLLSLGEDRYLTTVILKHFPQFKLKFTRFAKAQTIAPDDWKVLMSQRRRWINSTIHNLFELLFIDKLCGFFCFSMHFIVLVDLASTLISSVTLAYIVYLVYLVVAENKPIPTFALIMLGAIYGCQVVIYVLHRKFEHIGWMILYILALPFFTFILPLVSFWQMDDFSWGSTREIVGERGKRMIVHDEGVFDPASIPLKSWNDFENELREAGSDQSIGELIEAGKQEEAASAYGQPYGAASVRDGPGGHHGTSSFAGSLQARSQHQGQPAGSVYAGAAGYAQSGLYNPGTTAGQRGSTTSYLPPTLSPSTTALVASVAWTTSPPRVLRTPIPRPALVLIADTHAILAQANLQTLTKKGVLQELERRNRAELGGREKQLVNRVISEALGLQ